ncbi:hypothetical protein [Actinacidiphila glaucinigra]|uniref:hypothetical protein n=1 Tax=Actinacidiphila glaucinigra TaxID=235986 RepID=UPI003D9226F2
MSAAVRGLVAALLADAGDGGWPAGVPRRLDGLLAAMPARTRHGFRAAAAAVDAYAAARTGRRLDRLGPGSGNKYLRGSPLAPRCCPCSTW